MSFFHKCLIHIEIKFMTVYENMGCVLFLKLQTHKLKILKITEMASFIFYLSRKRLFFVWGSLYLEW